MTDHDRDQDRHIDELLESLLSEYSSAEPRPGLETRILANLQAAAALEPSRRWNIRWLWAGAAIAGVVLFAGLLMGRHRSVTTPKQKVGHVQPPPQQPATVVQPRGPEKVARATPRPLRPHVPQQPENSDLALNRRPQIFPTPTPLSEQELLLLRYVSGT